MTAILQFNPGVDVGNRSLPAALGWTSESRTRPVTVSDEHSEIVAAVIIALNASGIPYCVLGTTDPEMSFAGSDMDFVVHSAQRRVIPQLLASAASSIGAHLVQAIEHESTAFYFVIAKQNGTHVSFLQPDCTTDYRKDGRLWLYADELLRSRRSEHDGMMRPAPATNFIYYLIKKVLKQSITTAQWHKLLVLHGPFSRIAEVPRFWPENAAANIEWALLQNNRRWFTGALNSLLAELKASPYREPLTERIQAFFAELLRLIRRVLRPTGLLVQISGGTQVERMQLATAIGQTMAPAFRRTTVQREPRHWTRVLRRLIASTLVVHPELTTVGRLLGAITITYLQNLSPTENLEVAIQSVICHLSSRTVRRFRLKGTLPRPNIASPSNQAS